MIGRINSPYQLGRMNQIAKRKGGDAAPWYLAGGISPADCVAAYQPKGAASYAASKVNLANPGTYDAVDGANYPTWDTVNGWKRAGYQHIKTGIIATNGLCLAVRFTEAISADRGYICGGSPAYNTGIALGQKRSAGSAAFAYGSVSWVAGNENGIYVCTLKHDDATKAELYYNGSLHNTRNIGANFGGEIWVLGNSGDNSSGKVYVQAFAIYDIQLTAIQVAALTAAMAAL